MSSSRDLGRQHERSKGRPLATILLIQVLRITQIPGRRTFRGVQHGPHGLGMGNLKVFPMPYSKLRLLVLSATGLHAPSDTPVLDYRRDEDRIGPWLSLVVQIRCG